VEVLVSRTAAVDILPRGSIIKAELIGRYSYDWSIFIMTIFDKKWNATPKKADCTWNWRDSGKEWSWIFRERMKV
jgi:hypothetical protein